MMTEKANMNKTNKEDRDKKIGRIVTVAVIVACMIFVTCIVVSVADRTKAAKFDTTTVVIRSGDTLSSIAKLYCADTSVDTAVSDIIRINNMNSTVIYEGQELLIPIY